MYVVTSYFNKAFFFGFVLPRLPSPAADSTPYSPTPVFNTGGRPSGLLGKQTLERKGDKRKLLMYHVPTRRLSSGV